MAGVSKNRKCKLDKLNERKRGVVKAALRKLKHTDRKKDTVLELKSDEPGHTQGTRVNLCFARLSL